MNQCFLNPFRLAALAPLKQGWVRDLRSELPAGRGHSDRRQAGGLMSDSLTSEDLLAFGNTPRRRKARRRLSPI